MFPLEEVVVGAEDDFFWAVTVRGSADANSNRRENICDTMILWFLRQSIEGKAMSLM